METLKSWTCSGQEQADIEKTAGMCGQWAVGDIAETEKDGLRN